MNTEEHQQVEVYEDAIHVAKTLALLCAFAGTGLVWNSQTGYFYEAKKDQNGKIQYSLTKDFKPRRFTVPMLELLKAYTQEISGTNYFVVTPRDLENTFRKLFNLPLL